MRIFFRKILILFFAAFLIVQNFSFGSKTPHKRAVIKKVTAAKTLKKPNKPKKALKKSTKISNNGVKHYSFKATFSKKPALVNVLSVNMNNPKVALKVTYGKNKIKSLSTVKDYVFVEKAIAGINGSFFKPNTGAPIGLSIIDGELKTGPFYNRSVFGLDKKNKPFIDKVNLNGKITIANELEYELNNINQPTFNTNKPSVFTAEWAKMSPSLSAHYVNLNIIDSKIVQITANPVSMQNNNYVIVLPKKFLNEKITIGSEVNFDYKLTPEKWNEMSYAVCGGPNLIKKGKVFIDNQKFTKNFLWGKAPRTAIGYTHNNKIILVTVDGREQGNSEGATLTELARLMRKLGCVEAMNLDGGSSTQMIVNNKLINYPSIRGGAKVANAIVVKL